MKLVKADFFIAKIKNGGNTPIYIISAKYEHSAKRIAKEYFGDLGDIELVPIRLKYEGAVYLGDLSHENPYVFP